MVESGALGLLQLIRGIAKVAADLVAASDTAKRNSQLIEFQNALIRLNSMIASVQQENATLRGQKDDAEAELERMKNWESEKQRYELAAPYPGCMVYALKKAMSNGQTAHYLCPACFENRKRSILQGQPVGERALRDSHKPSSSLAIRSNSSNCRGEKRSVIQ